MNKADNHNLDALTVGKLQVNESNSRMIRIMAEHEQSLTTDSKNFIYTK